MIYWPCSVVYAQNLQFIYSDHIYSPLFKLVMKMLLLQSILLENDNMTPKAVHTITVLHSLSQSLKPQCYANTICGMQGNPHHTHLDLSRCPLLHKSLQPPSWSIKVYIAAQKFATSTDLQGSDTTWELRMHHTNYHSGLGKHDMPIWHKAVLLSNMMLSCGLFSGKMQETLNNFIS